MRDVQYRKNGKNYTLFRTFSAQTPVIPDEGVTSKYIYLNDTGRLTLLAGYTWDGVTGFIDLEKWMLPSACHDALYWLMRNGRLPKWHRGEADLLFQRQLIAQGVAYKTAEYAEFMINRFGDTFLKPREHEVNGRQ